MNLFTKQIKFIEDVQKEFNDVIKRTIQSYDYVLKDYVVNKQLFRKGIDGDGKRLPGYSRTTIRLKIAKGQPADRTTLHDTQKFAISITIDAFSDRFEIGSDVSYSKYLIRRYGKAILKPTDENLREFLQNYFVPNLKTYVNNKKVR